MTITTLLFRARRPLAPEVGFTPIAGVSLEVYARVSRGVAAFRYDRSKLPLVAEAYGVNPDRWRVASTGWAERIATDSAVGEQFELLLAGHGQ